MARRRFKRAGFNTKLIMDVGLAGIATRVLPLVVNKFMPLDPTLYAVVGAGGTYVVGSMLKKPDLANAGIALGLVELAAPLVENLISGFVGGPAVQLAPGVQPAMYPKVEPVPAIKSTSIADYGRLSQFVSSQYGLNDYISNPGVRQAVVQYAPSY
jgi:hypothetical protein